VVGGHVGEPFGLDPAPRPDLVEGRGRDVEVVEADGRRQLRERVDEVVVQPPVAPLAVGHAALVGEHPALEVEAGAVAHDPRRAVEVLRRQPVGPQRRRFHDVVVDGDDAGDLVGHGGPD